MKSLPKTLGELKQSGWQSMPVRMELRRNMMAMMRSGEELFPGILGYERTVIPQLQHSILAGHDMILLGLRGQGKTKILRMLTRFLDKFIPAVKGSEIHDDPMAPITRYSRELIEKNGDETPIEWLNREQRYGEKLATPDTTVGDLIGDIDPIKAASQKRSLSDEEVINYGLIPRTNRGIFVINELPDLQPRIQVALLNIMQERDIQIRGFNIRIPLDISMAFSANPEDYTSRGNLITPLKDRIDAQIITHYPKKLETGIKITRQEARLHSGDQIEIRIPDLCREIVEEVAIAARESEYVDQKSGVSTRLSITALEQACSAAERRALNNGSTEEYLRVSDFFHMIPALTGKLELVYEGEQEGATNVARHLIGLAISRTFSRWYPPTKSRRKKKLEQEPEEQRETSEDSSPYRKVLDWFAEGHGVELPDSLTEQEYRKRLKQVDGLLEIVQELRCYREEDEALLMDLLLEGLHQNSMLGKEDVDEERSFQDMLGTMLGRIGGVDEGL